MFQTLLNFGPFSGFKTTVAAVGLVALGVYQLTTGDVVTGGQSIVAGLGILGARFGTPGTPATPTDTPATPPSPPGLLVKGGIVMDGSGAPVTTGKA